MQFSHALIALAAASLANAQIPDVPPCSLNCFVSALSNDGCSALLDFACHCQKTELITNITPCVEKECKVADQVSVSNAVVSQCSEAGHPISISPIKTTAASSGGSSATGSSTGPAETGASVTATTLSSGSSAESSSTRGSSSGSSSGSASATRSGSSSPTGSGSAGNTSTPLPSKTSGGGSGSGSGSGSSGSASPTWTGAAANVKGNMAGVAALAAAAAYIL
ncbi:hypothetical protein N7492_001774 [Penicillium capsulatum]|uniref:CFEM domain-containing protein n=1 Tax=Penicillium capsulatum TaxID=69766 RepID=A0A9W9ITV8_9EURO|nr:hypothetical protein N7492_001774 [Penicillium capsulatum]KAJ6129176.1 hypothetical protein N7512_001956 [Penicillium capsulatum]